MILTEKNRNAQRGPYVSITLSTTKPTWSDLGLNLGLQIYLHCTCRAPCFLCYTKPAIVRWTEYEHLHSSLHVAEMRPVMTRI